MAVYLVKAKPKLTLMGDLKMKLKQGEIYRLQPFGNDLELSLKNAKLSEEGYVYWVEEENQSSHLETERKAVLDQYFTDIEIVEVNGLPQSSWERLKDIPPLWTESW